MGKAPAKDTEKGIVKNTPHVVLPLVGIRIDLPRPEQLAWYAGLGIMTAFELVDWQVALIVGAGHLIAAHARNASIAQLAEGAESAT
jgi:hypothetical protein